MVFPFALALGIAGAGAQFIHARRVAKTQKKKDKEISDKAAADTKKTKAQLEVQRFLSLGTGVQKRSQKPRSI